jgi:hypothetical protein
MRELMVGGFFERLKAAGGAVVGFMGKVIVVIILLIIAGGVVSWKHNHPKQAQATTDSLITAGASTITWASGCRHQCDRRQRRDREGCQRG